MTLRDALDRTLLLMRNWLSPCVKDSTLVHALTATTVVLSSDKNALAHHAAQCQFITTALLLARSGHRVYLNAPNVPLFWPQPPLALERLIDGLVEVGGDLLPDWQFDIGVPQNADIAITLGHAPNRPPAALTLYLNASRWAGELSTEPLGPWQEDCSPFGALAASGLAAAEIFKASMRKLREKAATPIFDDLFAATPKAIFPVAPEGMPSANDLGNVDFVSGGALTNAVIYSLARIPGVTGRFRVIESERGDLTNLQRYMLMRRSRCQMLKAIDLQTQIMPGLNIEGLPFRYDANTKDNVGEFAPSVLVGVDHIPSRWAVQLANPEWMGIAATQGFEVMTSFHKNGLACAGCANPEYTEPDGPIPTVAFVSFISGLMMAAMLMERNALGNVSKERQVTWFAPLQGAQLPSQSPLGVHPNCPIHRALQRV